MILVADQFSSDASRALEQLLRANQTKFSVKKILLLRFNKKCLIYDAKIPFTIHFTFNDHTIFHSTKKKKFRDGYDGTKWE